MTVTSRSEVEASYRRLHPRLWHALFAFGGDREIASDAEAEAFAQVLRRGSEIRDVDAWVWRSAFRIAGGLLKGRGRLGSEIRIVELQPEQAGGAAAVPVVEFLSQLDALTDQQRAIVALRYLGNLGPTDIAEVIDSTPGSVRVQLHRAHDRLRNQIEGMPA